MRYEDYIKKYKSQIEEAKKIIDSESFKTIKDFIDSNEYKRNLEIIKKRDKSVHKNILLEIEQMQEKILKEFNANRK